MKLYNSLSGKKETFQSLEKNLVKIYTCGPTVYNYAGIHNFSAYIIWDLLFRLLRLNGYQVQWASNITDVGHLTDDDIADSVGEDKLAKAAKKEGKTMRQIADFYTKIFLDDWQKLRINQPTFRPVASEYVPQIIEAIKKLEKIGAAYDAPDAVYFHVPIFSEYGKLSGNTAGEKLEGGQRATVEGKKDPRDFALWRKNVGERDKRAMSWDSPWGAGVPGWHIECSVMAQELLGDTIDIHAGGEDNKFPHHECEIAQSETLTGKTMANFWLHRKHLLVDSKKMSKSLGNFYRLENLTEKGYSPLDFRMLVLTSHYRENLNFTWQALDEAAKNRQKIAAALAKIPLDLQAQTGPLREKFRAGLNNDLNVAQSLATVFEAVRFVNKGEITPDIKGVFEDFVATFDVLENKENQTENIPDQIQDLLNQRWQAKLNQDFKKADDLRTQIQKLGYNVEDQKNGQLVKKE